MTDDVAREAPPLSWRESFSWHAALAGLVTAVVGFTSSFAVVLTGLRAVGADAAQASSGLAILCVTMGIGCVLLSWRTRMPITTAWSTPGVALLAGTAMPRGGFAAAVGAFVIVGILLAVSGLVRPFGDLVRRIPTALASAMLAGVLLHLCVQPFMDLAKQPWAIAPVLVTWLVLLRLARRWAVPGALVAAVIVMAITGTFTHVRAHELVPTLVWTTPAFDLTAMIAIAIPLYVVTMTSQNIPGIAVLASFGYHPDVRAPLTYTGVGTIVGAPLGGHAINLAAISAALAAGPEAHPDRRRRWVAAVICGLVYIAFGPTAAAVTAVSDAAPHGLLAAIAGVALIGTFAASGAQALGDADHREAAAVTFLVAASGFTVFGIGAAFWGLVAGLVVHVMATRTTSQTGPAS